MAMRTASPWWASLLFAVGLVMLFVGERAFYDHGNVHLIASGLGALLVVGVTGLRAWTMLTARGARRRVEMVLLLCQLGACFALILYVLTTKTGMGWLGYSDLTTKAAAKAQTVLTVLWIVVMLASLVPLLMIEASLGAANRTGIDAGARAKGVKFDEEAVEYFRVHQIALSGLSIALAASFLMVTCNVASQRNIRRDVSYFKTSQPGESTINIVKNNAKPIRALLFFPQVNEVKTEVKDYFDALSRATDGKLTVEVHDRETEPKLAGHYKVTKDGTVVLTNATPDDDKVEKADKPPKIVSIDFDTDIERARKGKSKLRNLDREANTNLLKLMRDKLKVYLTVGHGEINDPDSVWPQLRGEVPRRETKMMRLELGQDQYELANLGWVQLAQGVPDDATAVFVLGPSQPLRPDELDALDKYLVKGGHVMIALDPRGNNEIGPLEGRLGIAMKKGMLCDDKLFFDRSHGPAGHRITGTTQFSAHAATTTMSRAATTDGAYLIEAGALEDHDFTPGGDAPKRTYVMHSMPTSWLDLDGNFSFDDGKEKRDRYNLGAAIEGPKLTGDDGKEKDGFRALVYADADLFADLPALGNMAGGSLLEDGAKWLAGESVLSGEVTSEEDLPIQHTRSQDQVWFYLTMAGAPLLVLGVGLLLTLGRRRRTAPAQQVREVAS